MDDLMHGVSIICACFEPQSSQSRSGEENGCKHQDLGPAWALQLHHTAAR